MKAPDLQVRVVAAEQLTPTIKRFRFVRTDGAALPLFSGGAHVVVSMNDEGRIRRNTYSLTSDPENDRYYEICVLRAEPSRGGSIFMHDHLKIGDEVGLGYPSNLFAIDRLSRKNILLAGGIGITPFLAMMRQLSRDNQSFELHHAMRADKEHVWREELLDKYGSSRIHCYSSDLGRRMNLDEIIAGQPLGTHLYICGSPRITEGLTEAARKIGWPEANLHFEQFLTPPPGEPFIVRLIKQNAEINVDGDQSILDAIETAGFDAPCLCRGGACGQCETKIISRSGSLVHNDVFLSDEEKASGEKIMLCVSRINGGHIELDL